MKPACKISKKRMRWARHWCLSSVWLKPAAAPRAKNLRFEAKPVADFTAVCRADRGPRKAERGSWRRISSMAKDQKDLLNSVKKFGLSSAKSNGECVWMASFETELAPTRCQDFSWWRKTLWKSIYCTNFNFERDNLRGQQFEHGSRYAGHFNRH